MTSLTVIVPVVDEAEGIAAHLAEIARHARALEGLETTLLVVDDGSRDDTVARVAALADEQPDIRLLCLSRHFGKEAAIHAGLAHATGDAVIVMDSDLQHPPALLPDLVAAWRQGAPVVEACKARRGAESRRRSWAVRAFLGTLRLFAGMDLKGQSDFKLLDREVVDAYLSLPERSRFFRGLVTWLGYPSVQVPFDVPPRATGRSAWSARRLLQYSLGALTSFSTAPLQLVTLLGLVTFLVSLVFGGIALWQKATGVAVSGFTTVILLVLGIGSMLMFALGLIGIYLGRIYEEVKRRPGYLVDWRRSTPAPSVARPTNPSRRVDDPPPSAHRGMPRH